MSKSGMVGDFEQSDGTIDFYLRVRSLLDGSSRVLDYGAGRAAWFYVDECETRRRLLNLGEVVHELVACDIDPVVLENPVAHSKFLVDENGITPFQDESFDVVVCDWVLEHVQHPMSFFLEINRILKPGGFFCARTPHKFNYVSIAASVIKNSSHSKVISAIQPGRLDIDVFPTCYRLNTLAEIRRVFKGYASKSFVFRANPAYFFGNRIVYWLMMILHRIAPSFLIGSLFVFLQKPMQNPVVNSSISRQT